MKNIIFLLFFSSLIFSQIPPYKFYCNIKNTKINVQVSYDSTKGIYSYTYEVISGAQNDGIINGVGIDISTKKEYNPIDNDLNDNCQPYNSPYLNYLQSISKYAIPVGIFTPYNKNCGIEKKYNEIYQDIGGIAIIGNPDILSGQTVSGIVLQAKFPPGIRDFEISPDWIHCYYHIPMTEEYWDVFPEGSANPEGFTRPKGWGKDSDWILYGKTIGPIDPADYQFYNGGGQKPDDVNLFLKYANPLERETKLAKGENTFDLIMYYGETIVPSTFKAELNGIDITSKFQPVPKVAEVERLNLQPGRNTLILSVDGKNQKGQVATDTDRLVFIVEQ